MKRTIYGHRGAPSELPENTLQSFERALEAGADALEMDAQITRDGHVVILHDETGERMAGVKRVVSDCSLQEVQSWDVGWGWQAPDASRPFAGKGFRPATIEQVVEAFPGTLLNIDAKTSRVAIPLVAALQRLDAVDRVRIASFSQRTLYRARAAGWTGMLGLGAGAVAALRIVPAALLRQRRLAPLVWHPIDADAVQVPVAQGPVRLDTRAFIDKAHALGLRVDFWTIDDPSEATRLFGLGADGIVTNDPRAISAIR